MPNSFVLRSWTIAGAFYMLLVSVSHLLYIKVPGLFVFPDTASYIYQDRLIGMLALGWSFWLWTGIKPRIHQAPAFCRSYFCDHHLVRSSVFP